MKKSLVATLFELFEPKTVVITLVLLPKPNVENVYLSNVPIQKYPVIFVGGSVSPLKLNSTSVKLLTVIEAPVSHVEPVNSVNCVDDVMSLLLS